MPPPDTMSQICTLFDIAMNLEKDAVLLQSHGDLSHTHLAPTQISALLL